MAAIQPNNPLATAESMLKLLQGVKGSSTTETTSANISNDSAMALIKQVLGSAQGLASVAGGQKSAGLYNSTTHQQIINDLLTQTASKVSAAQQGSTRTTKVAPVVSGKQAMGVVGALQTANTLKTLLGPTIKNVASKYGIKDIKDVGDKLAEHLGFGGDSSGDISTAVTGDISPESVGTGTAALGGNSIDLAQLGSGLTGTGLDAGSVDNLLNFASGLSFDASAPAVTSGMEQLDPTPMTEADWNQIGEDATSSNFSIGSDSSAGSSTSIGGYLKIANYIDKPETAKDIFDLSDGDWKDDISDITDAASIYFPPAALVRPALNSIDASTQEITNFVQDPDQWFKDLIGGDDPMTNNAVNTVKGAVNAVEGTVDMVGRAAETTGNAVGDVIESIGDFFGF